MTRFRTFLNSDSRTVASVWNSLPPLRGRLVNMSPTILEQYVFSKPYFDPSGFIVAEDDQQMLGFIHAGFAPGDHSGELERGVGLICMLMVRPEYCGQGIDGELIARAEAFLHQEAAQGLFAGAVGLRTPYYLGLYGGSQLPGILASDTTLTDSLVQAGYVEHQRQTVFQRELSDFRPPVDRQLMQTRRQFRFATAADAQIHEWNETCIWSWIDPTTVAFLPATGDKPVATLRFWDIEPMSSSWGLRAMGLLELKYEAHWPREQALPCFLGEALRHFQSQGVGMIEVQALSTDATFVEACQRLGFRQVDYGVQYRKETTGNVH
jgi:GNAT superfamily N-acetyltransferase